MMSDYFRDARLENVTLNHPNFSNVQGDQHNQHNHNSTMIVTTTSRRRGFRIWRSKQEAEFEQYNEIKRGDIRLIRVIANHVPEHWKRNKWIKKKCEKKVFTGEIVAETGQGMKLTVVGYEGRDAQKEWLRDFKEYSRTLHANHAHLLAINRSKIPLLIFPGELVPAAHFMANAGALGWVYFWTLSIQLCCLWDRVWMDPQRGVFCQGPEGPDIRAGWNTEWVQITNVPTTAELLQEDVSLRFLAGCQSEDVDRLVVQELFWDGHWDVDFKSNHPTVFSTLTNTPIAVATGTWESLSSHGLTRSPLQGFENEIWLVANLPFTEDTWLSQAWSVFHALGVSLEDDLTHYKLIVPQLTLEGSLSQSKSKRRRRRQQPIYLFMRPLPSTPLRSCTTPSLHYWSLEEDGRSPLSTDKCHRLGLPVALKLEVRKHLVRSWSNEAYRTLHRYQIARGFDPTTTDFAQFIGYQYPAYKPLQDDSDRFEEVDIIEAETDIVDIIQATPNKRSLSSKAKQWARQLKL